MQSRGHEVEVLTGFPNYPGGKLYDGYTMRPWSRDQVGGVPVNRVALFPSHSQLGLARSFHYLSFAAAAGSVGPWLIKSPHIVYVYNLITLMPVARLLRKLYGAKVVLDIQDLWPQSVASSGMLNNGSALKLLRRWSDNGYSAADHLFVISPGFRREMTQRGVPEDRIDLIYNWSDEAAPVASQSENNGYASNSQFRLLFAGTMGIMQRLDVVIDAARTLQQVAPDVKFDLLGSGVDQERLMKAAKGLPNVEFLPRCAPSEVGPLLASADALLVHLKSDPLFEITIPSKIAAYMYAGKPIVCGVRGDAAALVAESGAGCNFEPDDAADLCRAVLKLRALPREELRSMGASGRRYYDRNLSLKSGTDRMEAAFSRLVAN
jgi:glycosyltransferase involved in cell wall biosynthesis